MKFKNRDVTPSNRKKLVPVANQANVYDVYDAPDTVTEAGTSLDETNLSKLLVWEETYNSSTTYYKNDIVSYNGVIYRCKAAAGTMTTPTNTTFWEVFGSQNSGGGAGAIAPTTNGTSGQYLKSNGTATPEWATLLPVLNGGTGASAPTAARTNLGIIAPTTNGTAGQVLKSNGTATPVWDTLKTINGQSLLGAGNISVSCSCSGSGGTGGFTYLDTYWGYPTCDYNTTFGLHGGFWPLWEDKAVLVNIELDARDGQTNTSRSFSLTFPKGGWGTYVLWNDYVNGTTYYIIKCGENEAAYYGNTPGKIWFYAYDTSGQNISPLYAQMEVIQIGD